MALILDGRARALLSRRHARTDCTISIRAGYELMRGLYAELHIDWAGPTCPEGQIPLQVGDHVIYVDPRLACYIEWHPITVTTRWWGPLERLGIVGAVQVTERLVAWERSHPDMVFGAAGAPSTSDDSAA